MVKSNKVTIEDFILKATKKYESRKLILNIDVKGYGEVVFTRPSEDELLKYADATARAIKTDKDGNVLEKDFIIMSNASKTLLYSSCTFLQNQDLQKSLDIKDPLDTPARVFGIMEILAISADIANGFIDTETTEEIKEAVKN